MRVVQSKNGQRCGSSFRAYFVIDRTCRVFAVNEFARGVPSRQMVHVVCLGGAIW